MNDCMGSGCCHDSLRAFAEAEKISPFSSGDSVGMCQISELYKRTEYKFAVKNAKIYFCVGMYKY